MRLAINIVLWAIALASGIVCGITTSVNIAHAWNVIFIGFLFAAAVWGTFAQIGRILLKIEQAVETADPKTGLVEIQQTLEKEDRKARKMKQSVYILLVATVVFSMLSILGRWLHPSNRSVFSTDLIALLWLLMTIHAFGLIALQRRLVALYRQLAQPAKEEEPADSE